MNGYQTHCTVAKSLNCHGQQHLLAFYDQLAPDEKQKLPGQIDTLDFAAIAEWIARYVRSNGVIAIPSHFEPTPSYPPKPLSPQEQKKYERASQRGADLVAAGKVAAFVVAGGQGTRLGFDGLKGDFTISPVRDKTLFGIFAETILAARIAWTRPQNICKLTDLVFWAVFK